MGMSGVEVYEVRHGWGIDDQYFAIVWRGKQRWSIRHPWDVNKYALEQVGRSLRRTADMEEAVEKSLRQSEEWKAEREAQDADTRDVMTRDVLRTVVDKPQYFY